MLFLNPPHTNGVMELREEEIIEIKQELTEISQSFIASVDNPICDTLYITSEYNKVHIGNELNGDTVDYILSYQDILEPQESEV